jgi:hypothetical protein
MANLNTGIQQEVVQVFIDENSATLTAENTDDYVISYYGFLTLGNTNDTVTVTLNGNSNLVFSMLGFVETPIKAIKVTSVQDGSTFGVKKGLLVHGIKHYKKLF